MKKETGFTLIELMITIAILAILLGVGVPSFQEVIRTNRVATITNDLVGAFQFARSEAVRRGVGVRVCASDDQAECSGTWNDGWVVRFAVDPPPPEPTPPPFRVWPALRAGAVVNPTVAGTVVFEPVGNVVAERCFNVQFNGAVRQVDVGAGGRVRSDTVVCP